MENVLSAKMIKKVYQENQKPVLNGISFNIGKGEFVGIMGASGSGKTTLLNVLSTIDTVSSGSISIKNTDISKLTEKKATDFRKDNIGFIFQEYLLLDSLTIRENIAVPLTLLKKNTKHIDPMVESLAKRFGIEHVLEKYPNELSGGQRQRAAAARALIKNPSILFADEPTGALDSNSATELLVKLREVNESLDTTILMVTHDAYAASFTNRIIILKDGVIVKELYKQNNDRKQFFEEVLQEVSKMGE